MLLTDYIGECLMLLKQFCRSMNAVVIVVAHPTKAVNEKGGRIPNLADIEGSMNWFNKCDNGIIVAREENLNTTRVISAKVREIGAGKRGQCWFDVDPETGLFTPQYGGVDEQADMALIRIEAILAELERVDAESGGKFREEGDREAFDIAARIERMMLRNQPSESAEHKAAAMTEVTA